jgi:RNA polymerase sigma-70 factor (ECF subfamily)
METPRTDGADFRAIVDEHMRAIYNFALRMTQDPAKAEDITQETFIKAWEKRQTYQENRPMRAWLLRIAHNTAIDHLRKRRPFPFSMLPGRNEEGDDSTFEATLTDAEPTPEEYAVLCEEKEALARALELLTPAAREVIFLYHNEEMTFDVIGQTLGESQNTVKSRYRRALLTLRKILDETFD